MHAVTVGWMMALASGGLFAQSSGQDPAAKPAPAAAAPQGRDGGISAEAAGDRASRLTLKLKDRDLREVVAAIAKRANVNVIVDPKIEEAVTIDLVDVHWRSALQLVVEQVGCVLVEVAGVLRVEKPPPVTFSFENTDIQKVIEVIAKISGANIVVAPEVKGTITVLLKGVPWRAALETSVKTLGFVVVEDGMVLRVVPAASIREDLETAQFPLRYVRPSSVYVPFIQSEYVLNRQSRAQLQKGEVQFTLLDTLKGMVTPEVGSIRYVHETNMIVVRDTKPVVDAVRKTIAMIDTEPSQIFLDVRFVTTSNEDVLDFGISPGGAGWSATLGLGQIPTRLPFDLGQGGWDDKLIASGSGRGPFATNAGNGDTLMTIPNVVFGALDFRDVTATLRLLKKDARSEILQAPQIVALDHQTATIFVGEAVRYAKARVEQGQAGGLLLALEEGDQSPVNVGFQLLATPHVVPGTDKVILEVIPQRTALTGTGASTLAPAGFDVFEVGGGGQVGKIALPRVASSTLATTVLLRGGQTAVLGGLKTKAESETVTKIPLLGDLPLLGHLFKNTVKQDNTSTLLVFITPSVIRSAEDMDRSMQGALDERLKDHRSALSQERDAVFGRNR
ncbi:MAG: hypothetical protein JNK49_13320 [Planctomycetes bacterium]|nr:hypothetical protein [Planctomycetota bacterium]